MGREQFGNKFKVLPTTQIVSFPFSSFPVSSTVFLTSTNVVLNINARKRKFNVYSTLDQGLTSCTVRTVGKSLTGSIAGTIFGINGVTGGWANFALNNGTSGFVFEPDALIGDYCEFVATVGATAPISGSVIIEVQEVI
jgi:hypothetical protein